MSTTIRSGYLFVAGVLLAACSGKPGAPEVQDTIAGAIPRILKAGKAAGILATDPAAIETYANLGVTFLAVGSDVTLLAGAARKLAAQYKS